MKIYAVTKGKYDDYHICALTLDKDKAIHLACLYSDKWDDAHVEEFEDGNENEKGLIPFRYWIDDEDCYALEGTWNGGESESISYNKHGDMIAIIVFSTDVEGAKEKAKKTIAKYEAKSVKEC